MIRLVQLSHPVHGRCVAIVAEPVLRTLRARSIHELALRAMREGVRIEDLIDPTERTLEYDPVYAGTSEWSLLVPFDYVIRRLSDQFYDRERLFVTGTGLTHKASVESRQSMHGDAATVTDSMKMYQIGLEGGRPEPGSFGAAPEWFYKGTGRIVRAHNQPLDVPNHGDDGGDEAELAGCYLIAPDGTPHRIGFVQGNEFSDHLLEAKNYLYLAQSKLRACSIGPEIVIGSDLSAEIRGNVVIERGGRPIWSGPQASGEPWMCHTVANLEHHHFKHDEHRQPGDAHIHFFGADLFSFKDRLRLEDGDVMVISFEGLGRPLRNPIRIDRSTPTLVKVKPL